MASDFSTIPVLDMALAHDAYTRPHLLAQLRHVLTEVGFLYISNHGVPNHIIDAIMDTIPQLFDLPQAEKDAMALENSPHFLGYGGYESEKTARRTDRREQFEFATELPDDYDPSRDPMYAKLHGPNQWPSKYPDVRQVVERYINALSTLADGFLLLVAEALGLPSETFLSFISAQHRIKISHYSPIDGDGHNQGVGPHKDSSGWWTFLLQASPPEIKGLQALNKLGDWIDIPPIPGTFVVNIGQAFEVVTNGACKATTHRVVSGNYDRYSIPFFQGVRGSLSKNEIKGLWAYFDKRGMASNESEEARKIDSAFLRGKYETWGETQLRTKIRSHRVAGKRFYGPVFEKYISDDG